MSHILLLEPNKLLAGQYKNFLEKNGKEVVICSNAQAAIVAADKSKPDLVIIELQLVGHSGFEFLYEFRSYPEWENVPVIVMSSFKPNERQLPLAKLQQLGVADYLYKSETKLEKLGKIVEKVLLANHDKF